MYREHLGIKSDLKDELKPQTKDSLDDILFMQERMLRIKLLESMMVSKNNGESSEAAGLKAQFQKMKDLLVQNQLKAEIEKLKEEKRIEIDKVNETLKKNREGSEGQMWSSASSLKEWMGKMNTVGRCSRKTKHTGKTGNHSKKKSGVQRLATL